MTPISYTQARKNFAQTMQQVCDDHSSLIITRHDKKPVGMMSLEDYNGLQETLYLMSNPKNAKHLKAALNSPKTKDTAFTGYIRTQRCASSLSHKLEKTCNTGEKITSRLLTKLLS